MMMDRDELLQRIAELEFDLEEILNETIVQHIARVLRSCGEERSREGA